MNKEAPKPVPYTLTRLYEMYKAARHREYQAEQKRSEARIGGRRGIGGIAVENDNLARTYQKYRKLGNRLDKEITRRLHVADDVLGDAQAMYWADVNTGQPA